MIVDIAYEDYEELREYLASIDIFKKLDFEESKLRRAFSRCITQGFAKKITHEDKLYGCMFGLVQENNWGEKIAHDTLTYGTREMNKMIKEFEQWAETTEATSMHITNALGNKRYDKLLSTLGYDSYKTFTKEF